MIYVIDLFNGLAQDDELKLLNKTTRKEDTDMGEQLRLCKKLDKLAVAWLRDQYSEAKAKILLETTGLYVKGGDHGVLSI